ncbi:MAG: ABC transporter permease [Deltaproteobacteria bacterium]|nr:ABC transporter permease [Deltaproteobacteria bacterium]
MTAIIETIGRLTIGWFLSLRELLLFAVRIILALFDRRTLNSAARTVFISQIYFTSVQILPLFLFVAVVFGTLVNGILFQMVENLNLTEYLGRLLMGFVVMEVSPFVTVLLIALRSSSAINAEIAVMKVNGELYTLEVFNIDRIHYLFIPRILSGMLSMVLLSGLFALVVLLMGLLVSASLFGTGADTYLEALRHSASLTDMIVFVIKCATFGFFITLIPIHRGLNASEDLTGIPVAVLNGMVSVFVAIIVIEVLSSFTRFI